MALSLSVEKVEETPDYCLYAFGGPDATVGRLRLSKASGDVEVLDLSSRDAPPRPPFFLAQVVPRLRTYHDEGQYPERDRWSA